MKAKSKEHGETKEKMTWVPKNFKTCRPGNISNIESNLKNQTNWD